MSNKQSSPTWLHTQWHRLSGSWHVYPYTLIGPYSPDQAVHENPIVIEECAHLQPSLFPDNPYWGEHLRRINDKSWIYRKIFTPPPTETTHIRLRFEGVDYFASVWLNGHYLGDHEGHFVPFAFDVSEALVEGDNELVVRVSSPWDPPNPGGSYPIDHVKRGLVKGLYEHGEGLIPPNVNPLGIWRPVYLIYDQGIRIDRVRIQTRQDGKTIIQAAAENSTGRLWHGTLVLRICADNHRGPGVEKRFEATLEPGINSLNQTLHIPDPQLWWPWDHGQQNLYRLQAALMAPDNSALAHTTATFGVRTFTLERSPERFRFMVNGRDIAIRGTSYLPHLYMSQVNCEFLQRDLTLAKNAHMNLIRAHVHISPPELYDLCNRQGFLIWQDSELSWTCDDSLDFESRARQLQRETIDMLYNHPSIIIWTCHNEPTMVFARRRNLEKHPDPALYADACENDPTRAVFICSGQIENDWERSGDAHPYFGSLWSAYYTDIYRHRYKLVSEFGLESPAAVETLQEYPEVWERQQHLEDQIAHLWDYQYEFIRYQVEHFRRLRSAGCGGYVHFWLTDLVPQVGCGVIDSSRRPKAGYEALKLASQPLHIMLEHDGKHPYAIWILNDTLTAYPDASISWRVMDQTNTVILDNHAVLDIQPNQAQQALRINWKRDFSRWHKVLLTVTDQQGSPLASNTYNRPFQPRKRPRGYPWKFDPYLGTKVYDRPDAISLAEVGSGGLTKFVPLTWRETIAQWALRQRVPIWLASAVARIADSF